MEITLNLPKKKFRKELQKYIIEGESIINSKTILIKYSDFEKIERNFNLWVEEVSEFLNIRIDTLFENDYLKKFKSTDTSQSIKDLTKAIVGQNISSPQSKLQSLIENCQEKINVLMTLDRKLKFIPVNELYVETEEEELENLSMKTNKIFISHSSLDSKYVEKIIDVLEIIGVPSEKIFCSSFEGYGVKLGNDFLTQIKEELNNQVLVLFILSNNFYSSTISLCEMGATWVKTNKHIPILIPPFDYKDVKGVIPTTHGMKINEKERFNSLKENLEEFLELKPINNSVWERKRNNILKEVTKLLNSSKNIIPEEKNNFKEKPQEIEIDYYENLNEVIKSQSKKEWPNDFEMQLDYIERQKSAIQKLKNHNPIDIDSKDFQLIRKNARLEWENDFEMQLDFEQRQIESLRRLNKM